ncbi:MAG: hypothetical protein NDJ90_12410 [Oligoflexia bacterium]|nr:hypothetical protein [Oligoflexia bacterium]
MKRLFWLSAVVLAWALSTPAHAYFVTLPASLAAEILSESVPMVLLPPNDFEASDFTVEWVGAPLEGVEARLGRESLQWVRLTDVLLLPRGRLLLKARGAEAGIVSHAGFNQVFDEETAEIPVALISGEVNPIEVRIKRGGREEKGTLKLRFRPKDTSAERRILRDAACSRFGVEVDTENLGDGWVFLGCRMNVLGGDESRTSALELYVFWDNVGQKIEINGVETPATVASLWPVRLRSQPGALRLKAGAHSMKIRYQLPQRMQLFSMGMGIGPYSYIYEGIGRDLAKPAIPYMTLYGSFFLNETFRVVGFNATAFSGLGYSDLGIYLSTENLKLFDKRVILNLLLGGHVIGFRAGGNTYMVMGAPQGFEMIVVDFLKRANNLSLGGFLYPPIGGKSYYNVWARWGGRIFGEFNFISWQERINDHRIYTRSMGLSVGFPLFKLF